MSDALAGALWRLLFDYVVGAFVRAVADAVKIALREVDAEEKAAKQ